jgi:hypothetical protein
MGFPRKFLDSAAGVTVFYHEGEGTEMLNGYFTLLSTLNKQIDPLTQDEIEIFQAFTEGGASSPAFVHRVRPGMTVAVIGDGAVGLLAGAVRQADGCRADHRDEPSRVAAEARPRVRRDRYRDRRGDEGVARIKELTNGIGADAGAGVRRHPGVDDAGDRFHPPRAGPWATLASRTESSSTARGCSSPTSISMVAPRRCAASARPY